MEKWWENMLLPLKGPDYQDLKEEYGWTVATYITIGLPDIASQYKLIHRRILLGSSEDATTFRQNITDECNMTAIAGAIIAQVAITGLSLANLNAAHWLSRALLLLAVVSGCLSVHYACVLQRTIGRLYHPTQIRAWLRQPSCVCETDDINVHPSLSAVFIVTAPFHMVKFSIFSFLLGLVMYQGFVWTRSLDPVAGTEGNRNVFIVLIVSCGCCLVFFSTFEIQIAELFHRERRASTESGLRVTSSDDNHRSRRQQPQSAQTEGNRTQENEANNIFKESKETPVTELASALQFAAQAHLQSAEADRRVASEYAKMSSKRSSIGVQQPTG